MSAPTVQRLTPPAHPYRRVAQTVSSPLKAVDAIFFSANHACRTNTLENSVMINYENPTERDTYENLLFISGIFWGIGSSVMITVVYDAFKERHEKIKKNAEEKHLLVEHITKVSISRDLVK